MEKSTKLAIFSVIITLKCIILCNCAVKSQQPLDVNDVRELMEKQKSDNFGPWLQKYIEMEEQRFEKLKAIGASMKVQQSNLDLAHPIAIFKFIKTMREQNEALEKVTDDHMELVEAHISDAKRSWAPDISYAKDGADILLRLQTLYHLQTEDMSNGKLLDGVDGAEKFSAADCFTMGKAAYNIDDFGHAIEWMYEARKKLQSDKQMASADEVEILDYLAFSLYSVGLIKRAIAVTKTLLNIDPTHQRAKDNQAWYKDELEHLRAISPEDTDEDIVASPKRLQKHKPKPRNGEQEMYEALCRGEQFLTPKEQSQLYCYHKKGTGFTKLAPTKVEIILHQPQVFLFHDVIYDSEIAAVTQMAATRLQPSLVQHPNGTLIAATNRISNSAWIFDNENRLVDAATRRMQTYTGLHMHNAEELQITTYGPGGYYDVHYDFARLESPQAGGSTVFPELKVGVDGPKMCVSVHPYVPAQGSALLWYNLLRNGEGDLDTAHASCPILAGSKWVGNKWIKERGQEFKRPCALDKNL